MLDCQLFIHVSKGPVIIMNQLKSFYNRQFKDSHSHPFHIYFTMIASNRCYYSHLTTKNYFVVMTGCNTYLPQQNNSAQKR